MSWLSDSVALHPRTRRQLESLLELPRSCYLFVSESGQGSTQVEEQATRHWQGFRLQEINLEAKGGGMEDVRTLRRQLQTTSDRQRVVSILSANRLSHEAQNALLKTLEEAPGLTTFFLHTASDNGILPTIKSRADKVSFLPLAEQDFIESLQARIPDLNKVDARKVYFMNAGIFNHNLDSKQLLDAHTQGFSKAKDFLGASQLERFETTEQIIKDEEPISLFLHNLAATLRAAQSASAKAGSIPAAKNWAQKINFIEELLSGFEKNANKKLIMANLVLNL